MTTIAELRDSATRPMLLTHAVPNGVLYHTGLALWEMPATRSGGYMNYLQTLDQVLEPTFLAAPFRNQPSITTATRLQALRDDLLGTPYGQLVLAELAQEPYSSGNSIILQNTTFSPSRSAAGVNSVATMQAEIDAILAQWPGALYLHLGPSNGQGFFGGSLRFNVHYALRTRTGASNPFLAVLDPAWALDARQHVQQTDLPNADLVGRPWYHCLYDITHPEVVALIDTSIEQTVQQHGSNCRYVVHGENQQLYHAIIPAADRSQCGLQPFLDQCQECEPVTHYPDGATAGFRNYLTNVLGLSAAEISDRWSQDIDDINDVDPVTIAFCPGNPVGLADFYEYTEYTARELAARQYRVAKSTNASADVAVMQFGVAGSEWSWLCGGRAASGDWSGETFAAYNTERDHILAIVADAARLSGDPMMFAVTAPPFFTPPIGDTDPAHPPLLRVVRGYTAPMVRSLFRDILTAGVAQIGYNKCPGVGFGSHAPSVDAVSGEIAAMRAMHADNLQMCGPWQRVCLHIERPEDLRRPKFPGGGGRCAFHLQRRLRAASTPAALLSSDRLLLRPHARWWLRRSLVVCPYPADVVARRDSYVPLFPEDSPGAALIIEQTTAESLPAWVQTAPVVSTPIGSVYRVIDTGNPTNVYWLGARHPGPCGTDEMWAHVAHVVHQQVIPALGQFITSALGQEEWIPTPILLTEADPSTGQPSLITDVVANSVTDGLTWFVGVGNLSAKAREVTVQIQQSDPSSSISYPVQTVSVPAFDTAWLQVLPQIDIGQLHVESELEALEASAIVLGGLGYDVSSATAALQAAQDLIDDSQVERATAAVVAVSRMCFVATSWNSGTGILTVSVRKLGLGGESEHSPVASADVLVIWPMNSGEEGVSGQTDGSGSVTLAIGSPAEKRWDFATSNAVDPPAAAGEMVHIEVCAPDGAAAKVQVSLGT